MSSSLSIDVDRELQFLPNGHQFDSRVGSGEVSVSDQSRQRMFVRLFSAAVFLIAASSVYDAFLVYRYRLAIIEQNPICEWLISLEPKYVSCFLLAKGMGTLLVVLSLVGLFKYSTRLAMPVAVGLVLFQAGLMTYLHGTDGRQKHFPVASVSPHAFLANQVRSSDSTESTRQGAKQRRENKRAPNRRWRKLRSQTESKRWQNSGAPARFRGNAARARRLKSQRMLTVHGT